MVQLSTENARCIYELMNHSLTVMATHKCTKYANDNFEILVKNNNNIIVIDKRSDTKVIYQDLKTAYKRLMVN